MSKARYFGLAIRGGRRSTAHFW